MRGGAVFDLGRDLSIPRMGDTLAAFCIMRDMPRSHCLALFRSAACALALTALTACSPALNWRTLDVQDAHGLRALFPCKPDRFERQVPWPGLPSGVSMRLLSCQAQDRTWALSYITMPDVTLVEPALQQWPDIMRANLNQAASSASDSVRVHDLGAVAVPRMTPSPNAHAWQFEGTRPDGRGKPMTVAIRTWHFSHGMTVFQASVSGAGGASESQSSEDVAQAFFRGFHFPG